MAFKLSHLSIWFAGMIYCNEVNAQSPVQFNEQMSAITDSVYERGNQWGAILNESFPSKEFSKIRHPREQWELFILKSIEALKVMNDVSESKALRMTMLNFLFFETEMLHACMIPLEKLSANSTDEEIKKAVDQLTAFAEKEVEELKKVRAAQQKYAGANGFETENSTD